MNTRTPAASIPVAWLKPLPDGYTIPLWRWLLLPATALMLKSQGGVWVNGALELARKEVRFSQTRMVKSARLPLETWSIPLDSISDVTLTKGMASETLEIHHAGGIARLMTARSDDFVARLNRSMRGKAR